jgi:hypothetical protein
MFRSSKDIHLVTIKDLKKITHVFRQQQQFNTLLFRTTESSVSLELSNSSLEDVDSLTEDYDI